jgi:hypothetical protein
VPVGARQSEEGHEPRLSTAGAPSRVAVAIEVPRGAVVDALVERGFHGGVKRAAMKRAQPP